MQLDDMATYIMACQLRSMAERSNDPDTYRLAADKFGQIGFIASQEECLRRANHYAREVKNATKTL